MFDTSIAPGTTRPAVNFAAGTANYLNVPHATGPAATTESDRGLAEAVGQALRATGYPALREIEVDMCRGIVVLWGRVPSYHQKQLAQATAQKVSGIRGIANGVAVVCSR